MDNKLTHELLEKAKQAKTPEELAALAKGNGIELTAESAKAYFAKHNSKSGEHSDDELDSVAGGRKCGTIYYEGYPVVSNFNSCEYYKENAWDGSGYCMDCTYQGIGADGWLPICTCRERRNN